MNSTMKRLALGAGLTIAGCVGALAMSAPAHADDSQQSRGPLDTVVGVVDQVTSEPTTAPEPEPTKEPEPEPSKKPDKAPVEEAPAEPEQEPAQNEDTPAGEPDGQDDDQGGDEPTGGTEPAPAPTTPPTAPPATPVEDVLDEVEDVVDEVLPTPTTPAPAPTPVVVPVPALPTPALPIPAPVVVTPEPTQPTEPTPLDAPASTNPPAAQLPRAPVVEVPALPVLVGPVAGSDTLLPGLAPTQAGDTPRDREPQCTNDHDDQATPDHGRGVVRTITDRRTGQPTAHRKPAPLKPCPTPTGPDGQAASVGSVKPPPPTGEQLVALTAAGAYSAPVLHRLQQLRPRGDIPAGRTEHIEPGPA